MNGVIVVDKPAGFTSFDTVAVMRGLAKEKKIGHTGTLDPMATGVLPLLLGRAAKAADLLPDTEKEYRAEFLLGVRYDTGDVTGSPVEKCAAAVSREALERAAAGLWGEILQVPPMYSAVSVNGKRLYQLARKGMEVERQARPVHIFRLELEAYEEASRRGVISVACSKGTYIRVLIEDMARAAGCCGAMSALRRIRACGFREEEAVSLENLRRLAAEGELETVLRPVDTLFEAYSPVSVSEAQSVRFCNGGGLDLSRLKLPGIQLSDGQNLRVYGPDRRFLGLGRIRLEKEQLSFLKRFAQ